MPDNMRQPVTPSAVMHAERIKARDAKRAKADPGPADTRQTYEIYGERAAAGARADEDVRQQALLNDRLARGEWVPGTAEDDEEEVEETVTRVRRSADAAHRGIVHQDHQRAMREAQGYIA